MHDSQKGGSFSRLTSCAPHLSLKCSDYHELNSHGFPLLALYHTAVFHTSKQEAFIIFLAPRQFV